jgi:hypothetical protein
MKECYSHSGMLPQIYLDVSPSGGNVPANLFGRFLLLRLSQSLPAQACNKRVKQ